MFEQVMERVLQGLCWQMLLVYLDDVIIFSHLIKEHFDRLDTVFWKLVEVELKLTPKKCYLFQHDVVNLGHVVNPLGISTDPAKIESIKNWPTSKAWRTRLTEKNVEFIWQKEEEEACQTLKDELVKAPILAYEDPMKELSWIQTQVASVLGWYYRRFRKAGNELLPMEVRL